MKRPVTKGDLIVCFFCLFIFYLPIFASASFVVKPAHPVVSKPCDMLVASWRPKSQVHHHSRFTLVQKVRFLRAFSKTAKTYSTPHFDPCTCSILSFVLALLSGFAVAIPILAIVGAVAAIVLGIVAIADDERLLGLAVAGILLSVFVILLSLLLGAIFGFYGIVGP